jgi:hypothetical protein
MSASSLNICDSAKEILYNKIFTDDLKVYLLKIQYVQDINRPQHYMEQGKKKNFDNAFSFFCLAMTQTALNNLRIQITLRI